MYIPSLVILGRADFELKNNILGRAMTSQCSNPQFFLHTDFGRDGPSTTMQKLGCNHMSGFHVMYKGASIFWFLGRDKK